MASLSGSIGCNRGRAQLSAPPSASVHVYERNASLIKCKHAPCVSLFSSFNLASTSANDDCEGCDEENECADAGSSLRLFAAGSESMSGLWVILVRLYNKIEIVYDINPEICIL